MNRIGQQAGLRGRKLYLPVRAAVIGRLHWPEWDRIFLLLSLGSLCIWIDTALSLA